MHKSLHSCDFACLQVVLLDPVQYPGAMKAFAREICRNDLLNFGRLHFFFPDSRMSLDLNTDKTLKVVLLCGFWNNWYSSGSRPFVLLSPAAAVSPTWTPILLSSSWRLHTDTGQGNPEAIALNGLFEVQTICCLRQQPHSLPCSVQALPHRLYRHNLVILPPAG